MKYAHMTT